THTRSDRQPANNDDRMRGSPEPSLSVVRRLQAENALIPVGIMNEAEVFDLEIKLLPLPLGCPRKVCFFELLPQLGNFNRIGRRKENLEAYGIAGHRPISSASITPLHARCGLRIGTYFTKVFKGGGKSKNAHHEIFNGLAFEAF